MGKRHGQISRQRRLDRQLRRRSRATSVRREPPRVTAATATFVPGDEQTDPVVLVGVPLVVGSVMFGDLYAAGRVTMRNGFEAFRYAQTVGSHATDAMSQKLRDGCQRVRAAVAALGPDTFAAAWHLLVAYVDRVGVARAMEELRHGVLYGESEARRGH